MTPSLAPQAPSVQGWAAVSRFGTAAHQVIFYGSEFIRAYLAKQKMFQVSLERWVYLPGQISHSLSAFDYIWLHFPLWMELGKNRSFKAWKYSSSLPFCTSLFLALNNNTCVCLLSLVCFPAQSRLPLAFVLLCFCKSVYLANNNL